MGTAGNSSTSLWKGETDGRTTPAFMGPFHVTEWSFFIAVFPALPRHLRGI
jgi:hypothetical protein